MYSSLIRSQLFKTCSSTGLPNIYAALEGFLAAQHVITSTMSSLDYEPPTQTLSNYRPEEKDWDIRKILGLLCHAQKCKEIQIEHGCN